MGSLMSSLKKEALRQLRHDLVAASIQDSGKGIDSKGMSTRVHSGSQTEVGFPQWEGISQKVNIEKDDRFQVNF